GRERAGGPAPYEQDPNEREAHQPEEDEPHAYGSAEELTTMPPPEADVSQAVADLDAPPAEPPTPAEPVDMAPAPTPLSQPEQPRRRSTVRERAPIAPANHPEAQSAASPSPPPA